MPISLQVITNIQAAYTKAELKQFWERFLSPFFEARPDLLTESERLSSLVEQAKDARRVLPKPVVAKLINLVFSEEERFWAFWKTLPEDIRQLMQELAWLPQMDEAEIQAKLGLVLQQKVDRNKWKASAALEFFAKDRFLNWEKQPPQSFRLYLPKNLQKILQKWLPSPADFELKSTSFPQSDSLQIFSESTHIHQQLLALFAYYQRGKFRRTRSGKISKASIRKMQRELNLAEFFPDDELWNFLRVRLLSLLLPESHQNTAAFTDVASLHQHIYGLYSFQHISPAAFLFHLHTPTEHHHYQSISESLLNLLKNMEVGKWVEVDALWKWFQYRNLPIAPIESVGVSVWEGLRSQQPILMDNSAQLDHYMIRPFVGHQLLFFAAVGWIDVAYELSTEPVEVPAHSLRLIRLTELGAYVVGKRNDLPDVAQEEGLGIQFSDLDYSIFLSPHASPVHASFLEEVSDVISLNRLMVSPKSFFQNCETLAEARKAVRRFEEYFPDLPANWLALLEEMKARLDPLTLVRDCAVFRVPEEPHLRQLIVKDPILKKSVLKAEGQLLIIRKSAWKSFQNRMKELGFFV